MTPNPDPLQNQISQFASSLHRAGVKMTPQRWEVYRQVALASDHPDAETIFHGVRQRIPSISFDTVYRTLWLLQNLGLLATLGNPRERVKFDANPSAHHHFICVQCGHTEDIAASELSSLTIPERVHSLGRVIHARVEIRGICTRCQSNPSQPLRPAQERE